MRFLLDQNMSPLMVSLLQSSGHHAVHVQDVGLSAAVDEVVLAYARDGDLVVVSADTDFGELLARSGAARPSVILLRRQQGRRAEQMVELIMAQMPVIEADLLAGAIVVLEASRIRLRPLPIQ